MILLWLFDTVTRETIAQLLCSGFFFCLYGLPPQSLRDSSPKGAPFGAAAKFPATAKSRPLGEGGIAVGDDRRGVPRRAVLSQKAALQMPFSSTTPPVKK